MFKIWACPEIQVIWVMVERTKDIYSAEEKRRGEDTETHTGKKAL